MSLFSRKIIFASAFCLLLIGCASAPSTQNLKEESYSEQKKEPVKQQEVKKEPPVFNITLNLYDNCPQNTKALTAQVGIKSTIPLYNGLITIECKSKLSEQDISNIWNYYICCMQIHNALTKEIDEENKGNLLFNTKSDGSGTTLDFSSSQNIVQSVNELTKDCSLEGENTFNIFAIYSSY